jgi:hypothetical protein
MTHLNDCLMMQADDTESHLYVPPVYISDAVETLACMSPANAHLQLHGYKLKTSPCQSQSER